MTTGSLEEHVLETGAELSKDFVTNLGKAVSGKAKDYYKRVFPNFQRHLAEMYARNKCVKILCSKDRPVDFEEIHVASACELEGQIVDDFEIFRRVNRNQRIVVSANGGAGKTFLMRFIWLQFFRREPSRVPIFIELRKLNNLSTYDLESFIRATAFGVDAFPQDAFRHFCSQGHIVLILDGFDEVLKSKRDELEVQVVELAKRYSKMGIIVSGRPDDRFGGWQQFYTCRSEPFDYEKFHDLITKVPFDTTTKKAFLRVADKQFFNQHKSFLSNPLLALMMLMTYRDNAEIPAKLSTFYENCFATLYSQHDALKEAFQREKHLDRSSFKRLFSLFCLFSYIEGRPTLETEEFDAYIDKAINYLGLSIEASAAEQDFLESVNLLVKDGTNYSFIHRSFQEYFSAYAVTNVVTEKIDDLLSLFARRQTDSTFRLAHEIHEALVEKRFLIPKYRLLNENGVLKLSRKRAHTFPLLEQAGLRIRISLMRWSAQVRQQQRKGLTPRASRISKFSLSWRPEFDEFFFCALAVIKRGDIANNITERIFQALSELADDEAVQEVQLPEGAEMIVDFQINDSTLEASLTFSKEYRRRPAGTPAAEKALTEIYRAMAEDIEKLLHSGIRTIHTGMKQIEEEHRKQKDTLSDFF